MIDKSLISLNVKEKQILKFPDGIKYGVWFMYDIVYNGHVIGRIEKEQYMDGTSLAEGFFINREYRGQGIGSAVLQMKEFRGSYIAAGNSRVRGLYKRLSQSTWKNFSEKEKINGETYIKNTKGCTNLNN